MKQLTKNIGLATLAIVMACLYSCQQSGAQGYNLSDIENVYRPAPKGVKTIWFSSENKQGQKGKGGMTNKGAKGDAFTMLGPGDTLVLLEYNKGPGIITKIWSANSLQWERKADRRKLSINMYWDGEEKPAVNAPFFDFFGTAHGLMRKFENQYFSNPEGRAHNAFIPMPFRKSAKIEVVNESDKFIMFYYKINMLAVPQLPKDALYFHAYWNRDLETTKGEDYEILPKVEGRGRFLGTSVGVIGNPLYRGTWFGEGEAKFYIDGDTDFPSLCGTGTEDYIGTGWGQGEYYSNLQGSIISNKEHDVYSFYRFHHKDPVYFNKDLRVTIQQIGNTNSNEFKNLLKKGADISPVWSFYLEQGYDAAKRWMDADKIPDIAADDFPYSMSTNFYRSDDVCAMAYFYLDKPSSKLPGLPNAEIRTKNIQAVLDAVPDDK